MAFQGDSIFWVEVGKIVPNPFQPRKEFNEAKLKELSESIRMYGILQPLTVTRKEIQEDSGAFHTEYELIAGERRLRASKLAGLEQVPVIIRSGEDTEQEKLELAIIENLQREDLNAVDRALAFKQLAEVFRLSHAQVGKKVGRSRMYVSNSIRLLGLPECILNSLSLGDISEGHARTLLMLKDRPEEQDVVYREIMLKKLSVREVERIARKIATDKVRKKKWTNTDAHLIEIEREFTNTLGTRVQIAKTDFGGKLTIDYFSDEDLEKLLHLVTSKGKITQMESAPKKEGEESTTVIQEMSPEASTLAKVVAATPLDIVEEAHEPDVTKEEVADVFTGNDLQEINMATDFKEDNVSDVVEDVVIQSSEITTTDEPSVSTESVTTTLDESSIEEKPPATKEELSDKEFAFITKHPEEARKEDIVMRADSPDIIFPNSEVASHKQVRPTEHVTQVQNQPETTPAVVREHQESEESAVQTPKAHTEPDDVDDDLYSMRNFSL
jgi:ParB family chromosome partitioning protein